jgi:hypothetical protein
MKRLTAIFLFILASTILPAQAALIGVSDPLGPALLGGFAAIIAAPPDANEDAAFNFGQEGFDEAQGVVLPEDIAVDGGIIPAGTLVNSHMIFLNTGPGNNPERNTHYGVEWRFDGEILGVMSISNGSFEVATSAFLGAAGTLYPLAPFPARGMEGSDGDGPRGNGLPGPDGYAILDPFTLRVGMAVGEPGDWIRVVTQRAPEPMTVVLLGAGLLALALRARKGTRRSV